MIWLKILNKRIKNFYFINLYIKLVLSYFSKLKLYLKLYFKIETDFNAFKVAFLDFSHAGQAVFFRYDVSIVLTKNRSNKSAVSFRSKI